LAEYKGLLQQGKQKFSEDPDLLLKVKGLEGEARQIEKDLADIDAGMV